LQVVVDQNSHTQIHSLVLTAFPSAPILSADEEFLYLAGAGASVICVATSNGSVEWSFVTDGLQAAEPVLSEIEGEDPVLYMIEVCNYVCMFSDANV
jgi:outer membrane protein assembly factor BamB